MGRSTMRTIALWLLPALLACGLATEVENLAPSHVEELGATLKTGGFFSALQTSGSFTMMQAGGFEELGEAPTQEDIKARTQSKIGTQSKIDAMKAEITSLQARIQDEEKTMMLGEASSLTTASSQHRRRAGSDGAAACKPEGTLDCDVAKAKTSAGTAHSSCKDSDLPKTLKYWKQGGDGTTRCSTFTEGNHGEKRTTLSTHLFGGQLNGANIETVLTKPFVSSVFKADKDVGVFGFKRVVCSSTTNSATNTKTSSCANFKTSYCVNCAPSGESRRRGWAATGWKADKSNYDKFLNNCVKGTTAATQAFNSDGSLKDKYKCSTTDQKFADYFIMTV